MKLFVCSVLLSLIITFVSCEIKDVLEHFEQLNEPQAISPHGLQGNGTPGLTSLSPEFHRENTVTNDLNVDEEEEEDYLDLYKLLNEDYDYFDVVDAVPDTAPEFKQGNIFELFPGKTRIQRLNIFNANFGFNLYRTLKDKVNSSDNILLAPVGISTAMAMISLGLKGQTHEEVLTSLGFRRFVNASPTYDVMTIHNLFHKLTHRLFRRNFGYTLRSVNDLYIHKQFPVLSEFKNNMKRYYFAEAQIADFSDPTFISKANQRILKLTKGLIAEALVHVNPSTAMMILNCLYFKGNKTSKLMQFSTYIARHQADYNEIIKEKQEMIIPHWALKLIYHVLITGNYP